MKLKCRNNCAIILLAILLCGCGRESQREFLGSGTLEADEVIVSSLLAGRVDSVYVTEGDSVILGQILALIDVRKLKAQLDQSEAALEELTVNRRIARRSVEQAHEQHENVLISLNRQKSLLLSGSSTQQIVDDLSTQEVLARSRLEAARDQLEALDARRKQLEAGIEVIRLQIDDGQITSPLSGTIIEKYVDSGESVTPGTPVVKVADLDRMWMEVYLDETDVGIVSLGTAVQVKVDALPDKPFDGRVTWVSPKAEFTPRSVQTRQARADLVFAVKVEFDNPDHTALIGMPAEVHLK